MKTKPILWTSIFLAVCVTISVALLAICLKPVRTSGGTTVLATLALTKTDDICNDLETTSKAGLAPTANVSCDQRLVRERMIAAGCKSGTDKHHWHGYHRIYWRHFPPLCTPSVDILELGLDAGKSLRWWREIYPHSSITGFTLEQPSLPPPDGVRIILGDMTKDSDLSKLCDKQYDVILDDASHVPEHQIYAFQKLFPQLRPGGVYVVEDVETSYWKPGSEIYGYNLTGTSAVDWFREKIAAINWQHNKAGFEDLATITFGYNSILITKRHPADAKIAQSLDRNRWDVICPK